ncbi:dTDP-glucose 4,6-dehydratase [Haloprofundus salinisoli]|uniref:dTDP-glucose 4,6-dehydratase n=1 Tax=Haloprofundus salinisoli TaxID=2876193 RepID=UPI001CC95495|nr:dTDP-glucose 4,6-dehydratase [Haloprofundus salinisoli]
MHILVTGGAGFIGSNFVHYLLRSDVDADVEVTTLDALTYAGDISKLDGVRDDPRHNFIRGDIRDEALVTGLLEEADVVVHFAAQSHVDRSIDDAHPFVSTNVEGTRTLIDAVRETDLDRFLHVSTDEVYGEALSGAFTEEDRLDPRNPYAATKASSDLLAKSYYETYGVPVTITRACNNFGPRQHPEKLIPKFITRANEGKSLPLYGDGTNVREWLFVEDHCRALWTVLRAGDIGEVYNIGGGTELENREVTQRIVEAVGATSDLIEYVEDRKGHDRRYALDASKLQALGWEPQWSFDEGLRATVEYYLQQS